MSEESPPPPASEAPLGAAWLISTPEPEEQLGEIVAHIVSRMAASETRRREFSIVQGRDGALPLFTMDALIQRLNEQDLWARLQDPQTLIVAQRRPVVQTLDLPEAAAADRL